MTSTLGLATDSTNPTKAAPMAVIRLSLFSRAGGRVSRFRVIHRPI
jgi:hypothetical protein